MKNIKCIYLLPVMCICFFVSCKEQITDKKFFDVPGYFEGEIKYIKMNLSTVEKTSIYNGVVSSNKISVNDIVWEKEFAIFLDCNINKPVYYANMEILDSPAWHGNPEEAKSSIMYVTNNKALSIHRVGVDYINEEISAVNIHSEKSNLISTTVIDAWYVKDSSYTILGEQKVKNLGDKNTFFVKGEFN